MFRLKSISLSIASASLSLSIPVTISLLFTSTALATGPAAEQVAAAVAAPAGPGAPVAPVTPPAVPTSPTATPTVFAGKELPVEIVQKILAAGVPEKALTRVLKFREENLGRSFQQDTYVCSNMPAGSVKPCEDEKRSKSQTTVTLTESNILTIIDYTKSSMEKRLFYIHLDTGLVESFRVTHGKGTGELYAYKFSNIKDSRQTSLGIYMTGGTYVGDHGTTLRMYGLEKSNDQAYVRDIVFHGSWYAEDSFPQTINSQTGKPYKRLGQSWGCPAVDTKLAKRLIPTMLNGSLIYHFFPELEEAAQSGQEVSIRNPEWSPLPKIIPLPIPRPVR